jgi:DNA-binding CsgD family transcriptional regulator
MKQPTLTERQKEVLALLVKGNTMREVATILKISPRTVAFHKHSMMSALKISSSSELILYAIRRSKLRAGR